MKHLPPQARGEPVQGMRAIVHMRAIPPRKPMQGVPWVKHRFVLLPVYVCCARGLQTPPQKTVAKTLAAKKKDCDQEA